MNQESVQNNLEAIMTFSYERGIVAYNASAQNLFLEIFDVNIKKGESFCNILSEPVSAGLNEKLNFCKKGNFQIFSFNNPSNNSGLIFYLSPILLANGEIEEVSISIEKNRNDEKDSGSTSLKESQKIKNELEYNKQIYSNLFYNNPDAVFSFDLEGNFVDANLSSAQLAETSLSELLNMHFLPLIPAEDHERVLDHFNKAKEGETQNYQTGFLSHKGTNKILEVNNFPIRYKDEIIGVYGIAKDITLQKQTADRILRERHMLRAIIDNIPDYIFVKDRNNRSILANQKFHKQILGKNRDESSKAYTPMDYFDSEKGKEIIADNNKVMNTGKPVINRPDTVINIDGKQEMVLLTKVPLRDLNDQIIGLVGVARDITETYLHNKKQELIFKIIKAFGDKPTFQEAMIKTLKIFCKELDFDYAEAYRVSVNNQNLIRSAFWPLDHDLSAVEKKHKGVIYERGEGLPGKVWESGKVEVLREGDHTGLLKDMLLQGESIKSAVGIPIIFQGKLISIFCLGSVRDTKKIETEVLGAITLQIASAIERKRSQDQLNDFFKFSPNLIAVIGMDGFVKKINPSFEEKFGFTECEILIKPFTDFIHPEDLNKTYEAIEKLSIGGSDFEVRCRKKDNSYLWISWRFSRFFEKENVVFIYGTDITPLKEVHEELSEHIRERKHVQNKLENSEKKYRSLFEASPLPMWVLDRDELKFLKVNKAALELYGYSIEEFSNMTVKDLWAPKQEERIEEIIAENFNDFFQVKVEHIKKNGDHIFVNVNSNPMIYDGIEARISLVKDVTDRIKAEEKLLHSEKRFKALVQDGSDIISIVDDEFNYIYNSPSANAVFGLNPSEINGTNFKDYIHQEDLKEVIENIGRLEIQKQVQLPSYRIRDSKDNWRWIETIITNLKEEPAIQGIVLNSRDITKFVEQEQELITSLERYGIVAKATSDIITEYDIEKDEMNVGEAAFAMFGYKNENGCYPGTWWHDKIHPEDYNRVKKSSEQMIEEKRKTLTIEYRFRCSDGSYKYILDRSYLITDTDDNPKKIIASMQDITERKQHLIAIENHNKRLKEIAWTQSHVVRAPLAKIMGLVDLLINYKNDFDNVDELLKNILISANELDSIIRKIAVKTEEEL